MMFESLVNSIKKKFNKTQEDIAENDKVEKSGGIKKTLRLLKSKFLKPEAALATQLPVNPPVNLRDNLALSPRAIGMADCAQTEIEWPILITDSYPDVLEKFTRIVTVTEHIHHDRRKHNDREEIRRRLATGVDAEEYHSLGHGDRPARKPSLQSRLQSGKHLQICYMNEIASDNESQTAEDKSLNASKSLSRLSISSKSSSNHPYQTRPLSVNITKQEKLNIGQSAMKLRPPLISRSKSRSTQSLIEIKESDFYALQATLQTEARIALAQAKEMARVEMERERRALAESPVTVMLRRSMEKANAPLAPDRRRVSRQLLTDLNVAQLQVIVNELHGQIAALNESLVRLLMSRDELHMGQDSVLVDIEDLTRYLDVKEQSKKTKGSKSGVKRLTSFVHK